MEKEFELLITEVLRQKATDLHFKSKFKPLIEMRKKGEIVPLKELALESYQKLMAYLIYRANIDLNHHLQPQTGAFSLKNHYFRLSYLPSQHDVHLVLRLLNHHQKITFANLGEDKATKSQLAKLLKKDNGLIVVCGPTGSGKSTTLHAFLDEIAKTDKKSLMTIEDPIEIYHEGVVQIQVNEQNQLDFAAILNQVLRHDPDVVMIGEIRDERSASIALRLALTGHLILTTLHTYSVKGALIRLENLGLNLDDLKEILKGIIFQRLVYSKEQSEPHVFFEIAASQDLKTLLESGKVTYPLMSEVLYNSITQGVVTYEEVEAYLD